MAASPECTPANDVLEHAADDAGFAVAKAVDIQLDRVLEEVIDEHGLVRHDLEGLADHAAELLLAVNDEHAAAAEHEGRTEQHREADLAGEGQGLGLGHGGAVGRLAEADLVEHPGEEFAFSAVSMSSGEVPMMFTPLALSAVARLRGVWPPNCTIAPSQPSCW